MENEKRKHEDKKTEGRDEKRKTEHVKEVPERKKIAVIFGGCSPEYGVSLQSAYAVVSHIDREKYEPVLIGISPEGAWYRFWD